MNFSAALYYLKAGRRVARKSYWPIVMWLVLRGTDTPAFRIRTSEGHTLPWVPSQTDLLADDWYIVE
ncbi:MAG: DUF2829 domain-containing protein [Chloroflexi bacterium]|nr:DUF2829 domain-containing protein [Chloroflexota bacterium]